MTNNKSAAPTAERGMCRKLFLAAISRIVRVVVAAVILLNLIACASVEVRKVSRSKRDDMIGVRFYRPTPYLVVSQITGEPKPGSNQGEGGLQFSIVWMPDQSEEYAVRAKAGFGSVEYNPTLENGWNLTGLNAKVDSRSAELLTAISGLMPKVRGGPSGDVKPGMYPFVFEKDPASPNYGHLKGVDFEHPIFQIK